MYFMGNRIAAGFGLPIAGAAAIVGKFGMAFDQAMTESLAIMDDVLPEIKSKMEEVAKTVASTSKFSAAEAAKAYYFLGSAGMTAAESMAALPVAAKFAQAGVMDLGKATEYLATAQTALGLRIRDDASANMEQMARVADVLTEANNRAMGTVEDFAKALTNKAAGAIRFSNKSIEEGVAVLAAYAEQGRKGAVAGTMLYMFLRDVSRAALANEAAWKKQKIAVFDSNGTMRNAADIVEDLTKAFGGLSDEQKQAEMKTLGLQQRSFQAVQTLLGMADRIRFFQDALEKAGGATDRVSEKQMMSLANTLAKVKHAFEIAAIAVFEAFKPVIENTLIPLLKSAAEKLMEFGRWLSTTSPALRTWAVGVGLAAVALGPFVTLVGSFLLTIRAFSTPVVALVGLFGRLATSAATASAAMAVTRATAAGSVGGAVASALTPTFAGKTSAAISAMGIYGSAASAPATAIASGTGALTPSALSAMGAYAGPAAKASVLATAGAWVALGAAVVATGAALYYFTKKNDELTAEWDANTAAFKKHTIGLETAIAIYDAFRGQTNLTKSDQFMLRVATEELAKASGLSTEAFNAEAASSNVLINSLRDQLVARKALELEKTGAAAKDIADAQSVVDRLKAERSRLASGGKVLEVIDFQGTLGYVDLSPQQRQSQVAKLSTQIKEAEGRVTHLKSVYGLKTGARMDNIPLSFNKPKGDGKNVLTPEEQAELDAAREALNKATESRVAAGVAQWRGEGPKNALSDLLLMWQRLTPAEKANSEILERVWEAYSKIREQLSPRALPKDIEAATRNWWEQAEVTKFVNAQDNEYIFQMRGVDEATEKLLLKMPDITAEYDKLNGKLDPRFFESNANAFDKLLAGYAPLTPEIQKIVDAYQAWKNAASKAGTASQEASDKAMQSMGDALAGVTAKNDDLLMQIGDLTGTTEDQIFTGVHRGSAMLKVQLDKTFVEMVAGWEKVSDAEKDTYTDRLERFVQFSEETLKNQKKYDQLKIASNLGATNKMLRNLEKMTEEERDAYNKRMGDLKEEMEEWAKWGDLIGATAELGRTSGASWADALSRVSTAFSGGSKAGFAFKTAQGNDEVLGMATALVQGAISMHVATQGTTDPAQAMLGGAISGATTGWSVAGWQGAAVGAAAGMAYGYIQADQAKKKEEQRQRYEVSEGYKDYYVGLSRSEQELFWLSGAQKKYDFMANGVEQGLLSTEAWNRAIKDMSLMMKALADQQEASGDLVDAVGLRVKAMGDLTKLTQVEFESLGEYISAAFLTATYSGLSLYDVIADLSDAFATLRSGLDKGFGTTETIGKLLGWNDLINKAPAAFDALNSIGKIYESLSRWGAVGGQWESAIVKDVLEQINKIRAEGGDLQTIIALNQPLFQRMWESQQKGITLWGGQSIAPGTEMGDMLKKAEEWGLVGKEHMDIAQKQLDVLIQIRDGYKPGQSTTPVTPPPDWTPPKDLGKSTNPWDHYYAWYIATYGRPAGTGTGTGPGFAPPGETTVPNPDLVLAAGGIVTRPSRAWIGEAGPEAVIPLDRLDQYAGVNQRISIQLGDAVMEYVVKGLPRELALQGR
jgi:TP901 family phage tail tape measure protein